MTDLEAREFLLHLQEERVRALPGEWSCLVVLNIAGGGCFLNGKCRYAAGTEQASVSVGLQKGSGRTSERGVLSVVLSW